MEQLLFTNNAVATMNGTLAQGGTSLVLATGLGELFPTPGASQAFMVTLFEHDEYGNETRIEIAKCTARTADTLTIERDAEGIVGVSGGYSYPSSVGKVVYVELRWTAADADEMLQANQNLADVASVSSARTNLGLGDSATKNTGTAAGTVAAGDHAHTGVYQPAAANLTSWAALAPSAKQNALVSGTNIKTINGTSLLGSGNVSIGATSWSKKTGAYTAVAGDAIMCDTSAGAFTVTLPASGTANETIMVGDYASTFSTNNLTISGTVDGDTGGALLDKAGMYVFIYLDATRKWGMF